jgi:transcriptional regulator with XRE-family HTH domain
MSEVTYIGPDGPRRHQPLLRALVGDVLRRRRIAQRRTLADVARAARVSLPYLSEVERGRKEASSEVLAAVCEALGLDLADFLAEVRLHLVTRVAPVHRRPLRAPIAPTTRRPGDAMLLAA